MVAHLNREIKLDIKRIKLAGWLNVGEELIASLWIKSSVEC